MRALSVALLLLAGCSRGEAQPQAEPGSTRIQCALGDGSLFGPDCLVERVAGEQGAEFVVRHPNGGFRRFRIAGNRAGMVAVDGADEAVNQLVGDPKMLQVTVGDDRYRFPADIDANR